MCDVFRFLGHETLADLRMYQLPLVSQISMRSVSALLFPLVTIEQERLL